MAASTFLAFGGSSTFAHYTCDQAAASWSPERGSTLQELIDADSLPVIPESQMLSPAEGGPDRRFGHHTSLEGDTLAIARRDVSNDLRGAIEIFTLTNSQWQYLKSIYSGDQREGENFTVPALSGNTLLVGAWGHCPDNSGCQSGAAYLFERNRGGQDNWGLVRQLKGGDIADSWFGLAVALDGDTAVVAAPHEPQGELLSVGAAYVFERDAGGPGEWGMVKRLESSDPAVQEGDFFGSEIFMSGDTILALGADSSVLYEFGRNTGGPGNWGFVQRLALPDGQGRAAFDGQTLFLRTVDTCLPAEEQVDHLSFFGRNGAGTWVRHREIVPEPDLNLRHIAVDGNQALVSATDADTAFLLERGAGSDSWTFTARLGAADEEFQSAVPSAISLDSGTAVVSWSSIDQSEGSALVYATAGPINAGHSGAWANLSTLGQGQLIDVDVANQFIFLAWFTYTDDGSAHPRQQRWLTAQGNYAGNQATLPIYETLGGAFNDPQAVTTAQIGEAVLMFSDCSLGRLSYRIDGEDLSGDFPIERVIPGSEAPCLAQSGNSLQAVDINAGMDGAWYDADTPGQGFLFDVQPDPDGGNFLFVAWFTYGDGTASGQRWLTAQGPFDGSAAEIVVYETTGGSFDDPLATETVPVGTLSIDFTDCASAQLNYSLTDGSGADEIDLSRLLPSAAALCEELAGGE